MMMKKVSLTLCSYPSVDAFLDTLCVGSRHECTSYRPAHHLREPRTRRRSNFVIADINVRKHIKVLEMTTRGCPKKKPRGMIGSFRRYYKKLVGCSLLA